MSLLMSRRLTPLLITQMLGALNDNLFKNALVVLILFHAAASSGPVLVALAGGVFILPYVLFSATAGQMADRYEKSRAILLVKLAEVAIMLLAAAGFLLGSTPLLFAVLFALGVQATFFGPLKYGILPAHLAEHELLAGNGLVEAGTFLGILAGTLIGSAVFLGGAGPMLASSLGLLVAAGGVVSALFIPRAPSQAPDLPIGWNLPRETLALLGAARANRPVWLCILGLSWFWMVGATVLAVLPTLVRDDLAAGSPVFTLMLVFFSVGVGIGSMLCSRLLRGEVSARLVPFAALGLSLFMADFAVGVGHAGGLNTVAALLGSVRGWRMLIDLLLLAASGGVYSVPLYAVIQERSERARLARMVGSNNVVNALAIAAGAVVLAGLSGVGVTPVPVLLGLAALNAAIGLGIAWGMPREVLRTLLRCYFRVLHRAEVTGLENLPAPGQRAVLVVNHQSLLDGGFVAAFLPGSPTFAVSLQMAQRWWVRLLLGAVRSITVDPANPMHTKTMVKAVREGQRLVVFPEGRITRTGALMRVYDGAGLIADKADAVIVPVRIDGLQHTLLSRMGERAPRRLFPRLSLTVLPAVPLQVAPEILGRERRRVVAGLLQDVMAQAAFDAAPTGRSLFTALLDAQRRFGAGMLIAEDINRAPISYRRMVRGAAVLGRRLSAASPGAAADRPDAAQHQRGGRELHGAAGVRPGAGHAELLGRRPKRCWPPARSPRSTPWSPPARSSRRASSARWWSGCRRRVRVCLAGGCAGGAEPRGEAGAGCWTRCWRGGCRARGPCRTAWPSCCSPAARRGAPKGVALSHRNLVANVAQAAAVVDFNASDVLFAAMPMFHSLGLTAGTLLPLLSGVRTFFYPSPLHYQAVPEMIYATDATIALGSDTFLTAWARFAHPYDFYRVRYMFAGAEKLRDETRRLYADRFGVRVLEGYGVTETAPVIAVNTPMHSRPGTVGRLLPGVRHRLDPVEGVAEGGRLLVRGPNVMLGYLREAAPGVIEPPPEGWYDTGDICTVDDEGFVRIVGRAKRFAKIAGEMVAMGTVEAMATALWPDAVHAVLAIPDGRKGEAMVLLTTQRDADRSAFVAHARARGAPDIAVPQQVQVVEELPLLGTGKVNYPAAQRLVVDRRAAA